MCIVLFVQAASFAAGVVTLPVSPLVTLKLAGIASRSTAATTATGSAGIGAGAGSNVELQGKPQSNTGASPPRAPSTQTSSSLDTALALHEARVAIATTGARLLSKRWPKAALFNPTPQGRNAGEARDGGAKNLSVSGTAIATLGIAPAERNPCHTAIHQLRSILQGRSALNDGDARCIGGCANDDNGNDGAAEGAAAADDDDDDDDDDGADDGDEDDDVIVAAFLKGTEAYAQTWPAVPLPLREQPESLDAPALPPGAADTTVPTPLPIFSRKDATLARLLSLIEKSKHHSSNNNNDTDAAAAAADDDDSNVDGDNTDYVLVLEAITIALEAATAPRVSLSPAMGTIERLGALINVLHMLQGAANAGVVQPTLHSRLAAAIMRLYSRASSAVQQQCRDVVYSLPNARASNLKVTAFSPPNTRAAQNTNLQQAPSPSPLQPPPLVHQPKTSNCARATPAVASKDAQLVAVFNRLGGGSTASNVAGLARLALLAPHETMAMIVLEAVRT